MFYSSILNKERTEILFKQILSGSDYDIVTKNVKNTLIKLDGDTVLDIYYRKSEIRIYVDPKSTVYTKYKELKNKGIAYQKITADPESTKGVYAFYIADEDKEKRVKYLLGI